LTLRFDPHNISANQVWHYWLNRYITCKRGRWCSSSLQAYWLLFVYWGEQTSIIITCVAYRIFVSVTSSIFGFFAGVALNFRPSTPLMIACFTTLGVVVGSLIVLVVASYSPGLARMQLQWNFGLAILAHILWEYHRCRMEHIDMFRGSRTPSPVLEGSWWSDGSPFNAPTRQSIWHILVMQSHIFLVLVPCWARECFCQAISNHLRSDSGCGCVLPFRETWGSLRGWYWLAWLSPYRSAGSKRLGSRRKSCKSWMRYRASQEAFNRPMYSAPVVDVATTDCFCDFQLIGPPKSWYTYTLVDLLLSRSAA
jgi:hypothetical protein